MNWITIVGGLAFIFSVIYHLLLWSSSKAGKINPETIKSNILTWGLLMFIFGGILLIILLATATQLWFALIMGISLFVWFYFGYSVLFKKLTNFDKLLNLLGGFVFTASVILAVIFSII